MPLKSVLNPGSTVQTGVLLGIVDTFIYNHALPPMTDIRAVKADNTDVETARRQAAWTAITVNSIVSLMTRDWNVFLIGGIVVVALDLMTKHANGVHPESGKLTTPGETDLGTPTGTEYPLPDYSMANLESA